MVGGVAVLQGRSSRWLQYRPSDSAGQLAASWHTYNFNACSTQTCWDASVAPVVAQVPLVVGEIGENDCATGYIDSLHELARRARRPATWAGRGTPGTAAAVPALISDFTGTPTAFGAGLRDHLAAGISP